MKFKFKKIASVLTSTLMLSSTLALAAAANYPAPFVQGGNADVAIVVGSTAAATDYAAVFDINSDLSDELVKQTGGSTVTTPMSISGEAYALFEGSDKIYINDSLNNVKKILTDGEMPVVLADADFSGNVDTDITQTIVLGSNPRLTFAKQPDSSDDDPTLGFALGTTASSQYLYNATINFDDAVNFSNSDSEGEDIVLFGQKFTIGTATDFDELVLFKSSQTVELSLGGTSPVTSQEVTVEGKKYTIELTSASDTTATIRITDESGKTDSKEITQSSSKKLLGVEVAVNRADESTALNSASAEISVGAQRITLQDEAEVKVGSDKTPLDGTVVDFVGTTSTENITRIVVQVAANESDNDAILPGMAFVDPLFGSFKIDLSGLNIGNESGRENIELKGSGNDKFTLTMTNYRGNLKTITFLNNESALDLADGSRNPIHVREGVAINKSQYVTVGNENEGYLLELTTLTNSSTASVTGQGDEVVFRDVFDTSKTYTASITSEGSGTITIGGKSYGVIYSFPSTTESAARQVTLNYPDSATGKVVLYPTIQTSKGAKVMLYKPLTLNLTAGVEAGQNITNIMIPDGEDYASDIAVSLSTGGTNYSIGGNAVNSSNNFSSSGAVAVGRLNFNFTANSVPAQTVVYLLDPDGGNIVNPALVIFEEEEDDSNNEDAVIVQFTAFASSSTPLSVNNDVDLTWGADFNRLQLESNDDLYQSIDKYGTIVTVDQSDTDQYVATISYPDEQVYALVYAAEVSASIEGGSSSGGGTGNTKVLGSVRVSDDEVSTVSNKNLIVVGGSCVNKVAAELIGATFPTCGSDWETKTGAGAGSFLVQTFSRTGGKIATLVSGYNAGDTTNGAKYITTQTAVDTTVGKKYKGTSETSASLVTTA